jgi:glycosyltransferase involved in cell wall biosynthesis
MLCFVASNLWPYTYGGAERHYYELALELIRRGYDVRYVTYNWGPSEIPLIPIDDPPIFYDNKGRRRLWPAVSFALKATKAVKRARCKVVDATIPYTEVFLLPRERTILMLFEFWGRKWREYFGPFVGRGVEWLERRLVSWPRVVVVPSNFVGERVRRVRRDVKVVPLGLKLEEYLRYRGLGKVFDVAIVSRLVPYKGVLEALEALRLVRRRLRVAVVGDGPLRDSVRSLAESLDHSVSLFFRVPEEEKRRILAQSVYYLHLSTAEGFSISTLEAIALGAYPIVLSSEYNAAVELIKSLEYGTAVSSLREAAEIIENGEVPEPPTAPLFRYHIKSAVDQYEEILKQF